MGKVFEQIITALVFLYMVMMIMFSTGYYYDEGYEREPYEREGPYDFW